MFAKKQEQQQQPLTTLQFLVIIRINYGLMSESGSFSVEVFLCQLGIDLPCHGREFVGNGTFLLHSNRFSSKLFQLASPASFMSVLFQI